MIFKISVLMWVITLVLYLLGKMYIESCNLETKIAIALKNPPKGIHRFFMMYTVMIFVSIGCTLLSLVYWVFFM